MFKLEVSEEQYYEAYEEFLIYVSESGLDREYPTQQEMDEQEINFMKRHFKSNNEVMISGEY